MSTIVIYGRRCFETEGPQVCVDVIVGVIYGGGPGGGGGGGGRGGGGQLGGPPNPRPTQQDDRTKCERMADDAQRAADQAGKDYPNATNAFVLQKFNKAFGNITFGSYFAEGTLGALGTTTYSHRNNLGNRNYQGDSGFHSDFRDTIKPGEDQVHHFGAFFSAGLAGHKFAPDIHRAGDRGDKNWGDVRLSDHARLLGDFLRRNPSQLNRVGQLIRDTICNGGAVPK